MRDAVARLPCALADRLVADAPALAARPGTVTIGAPGYQYKASTYPVIPITMNPRREFTPRIRHRIHTTRP